jgi:hypothetical protein
MAGIPAGRPKKGEVNIFPYEKGRDTLPTYRIFVVEVVDE